MKKIFTVGTLAVMVILGAPVANAQSLANLFGATQKNPGSVLPEWWNEKNYAPDVYEGALHLRIGSGGARGQYPVVGRHNCDIAYLFATKSTFKLSDQELDECAMYEFDIKKGIDGDRRDLGDGFVRQEVVNEMKGVITNRIELIKQYDKFYFRSAGFKINKFDFKSMQTPIEVNWDSLTMKNNASYQFQNTALFGRDPGWATINLPEYEPQSRSIEASRARFGIRDSSNRIVFKVIGTNFNPTGKTPNPRTITVGLIEMDFSYIDDAGATKEISLSY
ncbi:hypothetical protein AAKU67_003916 [Oxalobacteraceae bacterium GrIS 2.11]